MAGPKQGFNLRLYMLTTLIFLLVGTVAVAGVSTVKNFLSAKQLSCQEDTVDDTNLAAVEDGNIHFLLAGTDKGGLRTDSIMVATYDQNTKKVTIMSVLRDTRVYVKGRFRKINAAFALGKTDLLLKTLKETFGIDINYYITIDNQAFRDVIDTLGGIDIDVPYHMDYDDPYQGLHIHLKKGMQHLNGKQAEEFVRWRKNNTGPSIGDIERVKNQQAFMQAVFEQKMNLATAAKIRELFGVVKKEVNTNLSISDCIRYFPALKQMAGGVSTVVMPGEAKMIGGASYYIYDRDKTQDILREDMGFPNAVVTTSGHIPPSYS